MNGLQERRTNRRYLEPKLAGMQITTTMAMAMLQLPEVRQLPVKPEMEVI